MWIKRRRVLSLVCLMLLWGPLLVWSAGDTLRVREQEVRELYYTLKTSTARQEQRIEWLRTIRAFQLLWRDYPQTAAGKRALFTTGKLAFDLYRRFHKAEDLQNAIRAYRWFITLYPQSRLADDAQFQLGEIARQLGDVSQAQEAYKAVLQRYPDGDMRPKAAARLQELSLRQAWRGGDRETPSRRAGERLQQIQGIRHWSNQRYTRVVVDVDGPVQFRTNRLTQPDRLYLDLFPARLGYPTPQQALAIENSQLKGIRIAQNRPAVVRVVLDIRQIHSYQIFTLNDPFRVVIDVLGTDRDADTPGSRRTAQQARKRSPHVSLVQQLGLGVQKVVIDPGHGGKDPGAIGPTGLQEKDVVLDIGQKLRRLIERELGWEVVMTRDGDHFLALEERTAIANSHDADLFISLHANASPRRESRGIETYFLDLASSPEAMETAARENSTSVRHISDLQAILQDLLLNTKRNESSRLAGAVQTALVSALQKRYTRIENLGVKQAPFYVLLGAEMPSILIETSFISHPAEEKRLKKEAYRLAIARGILAGLKRYADQTRRLVSWQQQGMGAR
ncbi:MAG: AMIN domain-containing protein [Nitrospinota bacterium]|nr:MAG: AMIN domain-containing protein [Nitrospinota bacterium]